MADPNLKNFNGRLRRIDAIHRAGGGFEASGTLGMSYYNNLRRRRSRGRWLASVVLLLVALVVIKAGVLASIGAASYDAHVETLRNGSTADRIGAYVLQADPLTLMLAGFIGEQP